MRPAGVIHPHPAFEGHPVFAGGVEVGARIQIALLQGTFHGVCVQLDQPAFLHGGAADAGAGDVVRVRTEAVILEIFPSRLHEAGIVAVYVMAVQPGADTVRLDAEAPAVQYGFVVPQDFGSLQLGIRSGCGQAGIPDLPEFPVADDGHALAPADVCSAPDQMEPYGDAASVQGRFHDVRHCAILVGETAALPRVREEISFQRHLESGMAAEEIFLAADYPVRAGCLEYDVELFEHSILLSMWPVRRRVRAPRPSVRRLPRRWCCSWLQAT